jgi:hypothetical protein
VAILVRADDDNPGGSYVFWGVIAVLVLFVVVVLLSRLV